MDLQAFLKPQVLPAAEADIVLSGRFRGADGEPEAFHLKGISEEENAFLRRSCQKPGKGLEGPGFDRERYLRKFTAACVTWPDLKSEALQRSWRDADRRGVRKTPAGRPGGLRVYHRRRGGRGEK